jgi:hypothetical protein
MKRRDKDERPRASESRDPVGEPLSECLLLLKFQIGVVADMQTVAEMLHDPMLTFRQDIEADLKPLLHKLSQMIGHINLRLRILALLSSSTCPLRPLKPR